MLDRMRGASTSYIAAVALCGAVVAWAFFAWGYQILGGFGHTGIRRPTYWGFYIVNFVFWIGISHAGTLISAILRLTGATWRKPVTRAAEAITVFCLLIGGMFPLSHIGRVWLFYWMIPYPNERFLWPNFRSPLFWDLTAILTYLSGSLIYLYLPLIPDLAELARHSTGAKRRIYKLPDAWLDRLGPAVASARAGYETHVDGDPGDCGVGALGGGLRLLDGDHADLAQHNLRAVFRCWRDLQRDCCARAGNGRSCAS